MHWHILTGEYPPGGGGVGDHTQALARALAGEGDVVHVWAPRRSGEHEPGAVATHVLADRFGPRALRQLSAVLRRETGKPRLLIQYVPHAFGWKAMNILFCLWLLRRPEWVGVVFHEVAYPFRARQKLRHAFLALVTHAMASFVARAADRVFVSTTAWNPLLARLAPRGTRIEWLPIPSTISPLATPAGMACVRASFAQTAPLVGHFGTYGSHTVELLRACMRSLLAGSADLHLLLLGNGSDSVAAEFLAAYPEGTGRVHATGRLSAAELSNHIGTCDVMLQPFSDGVNARHTTVMVALQHGRPTVTTSGRLTEPLWSSTDAVAIASPEAGELSATVLDLLADASKRRRMQTAALRFYAETFDLQHSVQLLRGASASCRASEGAA